MMSPFWRPSPSPTQLFFWLQSHSSCRKTKGHKNLDCATQVCCVPGRKKQIERELMRQRETATKWKSKGTTRPRQNEGRKESKSNNGNKKLRRQNGKREGDRGRPGGRPRQTK